MTVHDIIPLSLEGKGSALTMSSREIAELTGKEHRNVLRDIRAYVGAIVQSERGEDVKSMDWDGEEGVEVSEHTPIAGVTARFEVNPQNGQRYPIYDLDKSATLTVVAGYDVVLRKRIIDRWQKLEAQNAVDIRALMSDPAAIGKLFIQFGERENALQGQIEEMRPQVQALDRIALSDGSFCISDAAKTLQVRPKDLFAFLRSHRWIFSRQGTASEIAYQDKLAHGFLEHKTTTVTRSDGSEKSVTQVRVTPKGLTRLAKEFPPIVELV